MSNLFPFLLLFIVALAIGIFIGKLIFSAKSQSEKTFLEEKLNDLREQSLIEKLAFEKQQKICVEKFKYLITMKTNRYKKFSNYEDLNQDGYEALLKAMKNYNPDKGIFFYWAFKYINTRISRCANLHTAIRYPLKYSKTNSKGLT